jgi:hypothetical protein
MLGVNSSNRATKNDNAARYFIANHPMAVGINAEARRTQRDAE